MADKSISLAELVRRREQYRREKRTVVWTNGCFDILHAGHAKYLEEAKALGDILIVGLNADRSVAALKGPERPYVPQEARLALLSALACVDHVILFEAERCTAELEAIQPDIYVRGGDYTLATVDPGERQAVEKAGGRIAFIPLWPGLSTSHLVRRIREADRGRVASGAFLLARDQHGRLLLVANRCGAGMRWGPPGGGQRLGESMPAALRRECEEEIGWAPRAPIYRCLVERIAEQGHLLLHHFEAALPSDFRPQVADSEVVAAEFFDAERLRCEPQIVLGRGLLLRYLADPHSFPAYVLLAPEEE
ncbi:MAG: adenylyltransferase/cytidyltransferase family protein [Planctomycetota bacterium]|nr:adenylyltransferase/cytidyltransferase family protein [Planctomycetota bacterium]